MGGLKTLFGSPLSPLHLKRPDFQPIDPEKLREIDESLADIPLRFIRKHLEATTLQFSCSISSVTVPKIQSVPEEIDITVNYKTIIYPTHVLALTNSQIPKSRGPICLFPIHSIMFAAYCAKMPSLPPALPAPSGKPPTIRVPVYVLAVPHPETFGALHAFFYYGDSLKLAMDLITLLPPVTLFEDRSQIVEYAQRLTSKFDRNFIFELSSKIYGFWQNSCALGVDNEQLWNTIDVLWEVLVESLGSQLTLSSP